MKLEPGQKIACGILIVISIAFLAAGIYVLACEMHRGDPLNIVGGILLISMALVFSHRVLVAIKL